MWGEREERKSGVRVGRECGSFKKAWQICWLNPQSSFPSEDYPSRSIRHLFVSGSSILQLLRQHDCWGSYWVKSVWLHQILKECRDLHVFILLCLCLSCNPYILLFYHFIFISSLKSSRIYKRLNYYKSLYDSIVTSTLLYREPWINQSMEAVGGYNWFLLDSTYSQSLIEHN